MILWKTLVYTTAYNMRELLEVEQQVSAANGKKHEPTLELKRHAHLKRRPMICMIFNLRFRCILPIRTVIISPMVMNGPPLRARSVHGWCGAHSQTVSARWVCLCLEKREFRVNSLRALKMTNRSNPRVCRFDRSTYQKPPLNIKQSSILCFYIALI